MSKDWKTKIQKLKSISTLQDAKAIATENKKLKPEIRHFQMQKISQRKTKI